MVAAVAFFVELRSFVAERKGDNNYRTLLHGAAQLRSREKKATTAAVTFFVELRYAAAPH